MSDNEFVDDADLDTSTASDGSALRKFGEGQKKRADSLEKQLNELRAEIAKRDAATVFTELGVPEKVRKFYTGEEFTKDAIGAWMKENADVFGFNTEAEQTPEQAQKMSDLDKVSQAALAGQDRQTALSRDSMKQMASGLMSEKNASLDDILGKMNVPDVPLQAPRF